MGLGVARVAFVQGVDDGAEDEVLGLLLLHLSAEGGHFSSQMQDYATGHVCIWPRLRISHDGGNLFWCRLGAHAAPTGLRMNASTAATRRS